MAVKKKKPAKAAKPTKKPAKKAAKPVKAVAKKKAAPVKAKKAAKPVKKAAPKAAAKKTAPPVKVPKKEAAPKSAPEKVKSAKGKVSEVDTAPDIEVEKPEDVVLTDAEGRRYCRVKDCDQIAVVDVYCRYHYLLFWKKIQVRKKILSEGKLERYIEELTARYPDKFLDMLRKDLRSEKEFLAAIQELEIDESSVENELEDEAQNYIDEVRGVSETSSVGSEEEF